MYKHDFLDSASSLELAGRCGGLESVVLIMRSHPAVEAVQEYVQQVYFGILYLLFRHGLRAIVRITLNNSNWIKKYLHFLCVLLLCIAQNVAVAGRCGVIKVILATMKAYRTIASIQEQGCFALVNVTYANGESLC